MKKEIVSFPLDKVVPDKANPRKEKEENEIKELADSIQENGQEEPIQIEKLNGKYLILEGHRRYFAMCEIEKRTGKKQVIECIVRNTMTKEERLLKRAVMDNQAKNWSIEERDEAWAEIWKTKDWKIVEFAKKLGTRTDQVGHFLERMELKEKDPKLYKALENKYGLLQETKVLKGNNRKKVLRYALQKKVGAMALREDVRILKKASDNLIDSFTKGEISIEDVEKLTGLDDEKQKVGIHAIKGMQTKIKKVGTILKKSQIKDADPKIKTAHEFMERLQDEILDTTNQLMAIEGVLETIKKKNYDQYFSPKMRTGLNECLTQLELGMKKTTKQVRDSINDWEVKQIE